MTAADTTTSKPSHPDRLKGKGTKPIDDPSHLPPQSLEAEEAILGAMLISERAVEAAASMRLRAEHFYRPSHRIVFDAIQQLAAVGEVDELTVINRLKSERTLGQVGGAAAVMTLAERCPAVANCRAYVREVLDQATLRALVETGHEIAKLGYEHPDAPPQLVARAGELVANLDAPGGQVEWVTMDELADALYDQWHTNAEEGRTPGRSTGFEHLDARTGGLQRGAVTVVAGRPGMGKTAFAMNVAENVALDGGHVAIFSGEMTPDDLTTRVISGMSKIDSHRLYNTAPQPNDWQHIAAAIQRLKERAPGRLRVSTSRTHTVGQIVSSTRRLARALERESKTLDLVVIDYLGRISAGRRIDNRVQEVGFISQAIKDMALELNVPVMLLSQLNRGVEMRPDKRPMLSDLRESGDVEQDADTVLLLFRPEYYLREETPPEKQGKAEVIVAKLRRGEPRSVWLGWLGKYTRFVTLTRDDRAPTPPPSPEIH